MWTCSVSVRLCSIMIMINNSVFRPNVHSNWAAVVMQDRAITHSATAVQMLARLDVSAAGGDLLLLSYSAARRHIAALRTAVAKSAGFSTVTWTKKLWFYFFAEGYQTSIFFNLYVLLTSDKVNTINFNTYFIPFFLLKMKKLAVTREWKLLWRTQSSRNWTLALHWMKVND